MNLLMGVCLAFAIGLLAGAVFRVSNRLVILGLTACGGVALATVVIVYYSMILRIIFPGSSSPEHDPVWSSATFAPLLFSLGALITVVGYQFGQRVARLGNNNTQRSKHTILVRSLPALGSLVFIGFLVGQNWMFQQQLARLARLQQVASVSFSYGRPAVSWLRLMDVPVRLRPLLSRDNVPTGVYFAPGTKNPGLHIQESRITEFEMVEFQDIDINAQDILSLTQNRQLTYLLFDKCRFSEGVLSSLSFHPRLLVLTIRECTLSSNNQFDFSSLPFLQSLDLSGTNVNDEFLSGLAGHSWLARCNLRNTPISDAGVRHIQNLLGLRFLDLSGTHVTDTGLSGIQAPLESLYVDGDAVGDTAMGVISKLSSLQTLSIPSTKVTSAGVAQIVRLPRLATLVIDQCDVGDEVRPHLSALPNSVRWSARHTRMTLPDFHDPQ